MLLSLLLFWHWIACIYYELSRQSAVSVSLFDPWLTEGESDFAPPPRAPVGPSDAWDGLGLTAVAYSTTLSLKKFSVSLRISICGLTNMAMSHIPPSSRQTRQSRRK